MWRSMFDENDRRRILARLERLEPDASRRWGMMDAAQMVAHLTDQMRHALELSPVESRPGILRWPPVRWASIYLLPWPRGRIKGPPEAFLTQPISWQSDVAELVSLVERFAERGAGAAWREHPLFGRMTGRDWGVFVHKHFDYHLRQFGG